MSLVVLLKFHKDLKNLMLTFKLSQMKISTSTKFMITHNTEKKAAKKSS